MNDKEAIEERYISIIISLKEQVHKIDAWNFYNPNRRIHIDELDKRIEASSNNTTQTELII